MNEALAVNANELMVDRVIECVTRHLELLLEHQRLRPLKGSARDHATTRFGRWIKKPQLAHVFVLLERNNERFVPQPEIARMVKMSSKKGVQSMLFDLRKWNIECVDEDGVAKKLFPFVTGQHLWPHPPKMHSDGKVRSGIKMRLAYHKPALKYSDAVTLNAAEKNRLATSLAVAEGSASVIIASAECSEAERATAQDEAESARARVDGMQLGLPLAKPANEDA